MDLQDPDLLPGGDGAEGKAVPRGVDLQPVLPFFHKPLESEHAAAGFVLPQSGRTAAQLREQTERAEKAAATLAERETALEEAKSREKELETAVNRLEKEVGERREREEALEREKEEQKKTLEALAVQLAQLKTEHAKNVDYVKTLLHSNKMKDRGRNAERSEV